MDDYISRDDFAKHLDDIQYGEAPTGRTGENIDYQKGVYAGFDMAYVALKRFPTADVRPVVRGKWKRDDTEINGQKFPIGYRCSVCGTKFLIIDDPRFNFCAACGADMRGGKQ